MSNSVEKFINIISAIITIFTFIGSIIPPFNNNQIKLPYFLNEPLSLSRLFISGVLILSCSYILAYVCSYVYHVNVKKASKSFYIGLISLVSAWLNIFTLKYILYSNIFASNFLNTAGFIILLIICIYLISYFTKIHYNENNEPLLDENNMNLLQFLIATYIIFGFTTIAIS